MNRIGRGSACALVAAMLAGCGTAHQPKAASASASATARPVQVEDVIPRMLRPTPTPTPQPTIDPGTLPQTHVRPGTDDPTFQAGVQSLWQAIVTDNPATAMPFFFPSTAYVQVKDIWNPLDDYQNRLVALYRLDIEAAHAHLGSDPYNAEFVSVQVPESQAEWIEPGEEYNKGSYYRVYGTRLSYRVAGSIRSIGIFSLISWRGEWYCVHLGPSSRYGFEGEVFDPA